jgi:H/ACA ribonucleoprotein complex subunit 2
LTGGVFNISIVVSNKKMTSTTQPSPLRDSNGLAIIATPLATEKLLKKTLKLVKKANKDKRMRRGVREVQKALRKKTQGLCVIAGDTSPLDVISHFAALCEENDVPYVYVPSKAALGAAGATKRSTSVVMVCPGDGWEHADDYSSLTKKLKILTSKEDE